jgi:hypothetical protein
MPSDSPKPTNICHVCGATSYRYVIERNDGGQMKPTQQLQCNGCKKLFSDVQDWRNGPSAPSAEHPA